MLSIPNRIFFEDVCQRIQQQRSVKIRVCGKSMEPFVKDGMDFVIVSPLSPQPDFRKGDLLLFLYRDHYIVHRIHRTEGERLFMKGDNQNHLEIINKTDVLARISSVEYANGLRIRNRSILWKWFTLCSRVTRIRKNFHHRIKRLLRSRKD